MTMLFTDVQSLNALVPIASNDSGSSMPCKAEHPVNAEFPMFVTESGISIDSMDAHPENVVASMEFNDDGSVTETRDEQLLKAELLMTVLLPSNMTSVNDLQP